MSLPPPSRSPRSAIAGAILALAAIAPLGAQASSSPPVRVRWPAANVLVSTDSASGVTFWIATNTSAVADGQPASREAILRFHPDSLLAWTDLTRQLLEASAPPIPGDSSPVVTSGLLRGAGGGLLVAARQRDGEHLSRAVKLLVDPRNGTPAMVFELSGGDVSSLVALLDDVARRSGWRPTPPRAPGGPLAERVASAPDGRPFAPHYPSEAAAEGREGEVWARFVVRPDGRPDVDSFRALLSDDSRFESAVREFLAVAHYRPAVVDGKAVPQAVMQRFVFRESTDTRLGEESELFGELEP